MLSLENFSHHYANSDFRLGPFNLDVQPGECLGVMGQNGAGKSTLFQILTGNLRLSEGSARFGDQPISISNYALKKRFGYLPQNLELPKWVSAKELFSYAANLYELQNSQDIIESSLDYWDIRHFADRPLTACSHGMKKRVSLGLATIHSPDILILDEPFSGLDLFHIKALQDNIQERKQQKLITILSTHIAPYTASLCSRLVGIRRGELLPVEPWGDKSALEKIEIVESFFFKNET
ncbi:MAG: ABC transporter ATP-binding protein [Pseudobacteriovorax sp.]|nr:ABC transporter ATP-binding protein [Pseudobacteriovorax sp.]